MKTIIRKCKRCKSNFVRKNKYHVFCTEQCKKKFAYENDKGSVVSCSNCFKNKKVKKYAIARSKSNPKKYGNFFCNRKCESEFRMKQSFDIRKCKECNTDFECKKYEKLIFCSVKCQGKWQSKTRIGVNSSNYNHNYTHRERTCKFCEKIYTVNMRKKKSIYCSFSCKVQDFNKTLTLPHRIAIEILSKHNIAHINEYQVKRFLLDIFLPDRKLGIEIMGQYWHCDFRVFPVPIDDIQVKSISRDIRKSKILTENGIKTLYLWEKDLMEERVMCEKIIIEFINYNGDIDNKHSFNYLLENNTLLLRSKIVDIGY